MQPNSDPNIFFCPLYNVELCPEQKDHIDTELEDAFSGLSINTSAPTSAHSDYISSRVTSSSLSITTLLGIRVKPSSYKEQCKMAGQVRSEGVEKVEAAQETGEQVELPVAELFRLPEDEQPSSCSKASQSEKL